jgi:hypothetical protein
MEGSPAVDPYLDSIRCFEVVEDRREEPEVVTHDPDPQIATLPEPT